MSVAASVVIHFDLTSCASCGIQFQLPRSYDDKRREDGKTFYCPNGHSLSYGEGEATRLRRFLDAERESHKRTRGRLDQERNSHRATRGHLTRHRKRSAAGVCPCCNRTFQQLSRHMKRKHPDYVKEHA